MPCAIVVQHITLNQSFTISAYKSQTKCRSHQNCRKVPANNCHFKVLGSEPVMGYSGLNAALYKLSTYDRRVHWNPKHYRWVEPPHHPSQHHRWKSKFHWCRFQRCPQSLGRILRWWMWFHWTDANQTVDNLVLEEEGSHLPGKKNFNTYSIHCNSLIFYAQNVLCDIFSC